MNTHLAGLAIVSLLLSGAVRAQPAQVPEPTDEVIRLAVENELLRSGTVEAHAIGVGADHGIVTLSGRVHNLLASALASRLAQRVRGVQSVINQMEINPVQRDDAGLKKDIKAALKADAATAKLDVKVGVSFSRATLTGSVPASGLKTLASRVASGVKGVVAIDNQIAVDPKWWPADADLQSAIQQLFEYSALLDDVELKVTVKDGTAVVTGSVGSSLQKSHAADIALNAGAQAVDDRGIKVSWHETNPELRSRRYQQATDEQIQAAVLRAFKADPRLLSYTPQVKVVKGDVILTGVVGVLVAKECATSDARHTIGVRKVENHLRVNWPDQPPSDDAMAVFTRDALLRDPYVARHSLIVTCENAHVSLYGVVDTEFEKEHAEWITSCQNSVVHVADYLTVRKQWVPKSDAAIASYLKDKLAYDFVDPDNQVTATVVDGVAILQGTVDSWLMWQQALDRAIEAGARRPHNLIQVRYGEESAPHFYQTHEYEPE
jgi:osmotically-inducible protein OsmY